MFQFKSVVTVGGFTLLSRIFGFIRDMVIAAVMGAGPLSDAFFVAFKLPNFFRRLFAEGAFNSAFVPLFAGKLTEEGLENSKIFAGKILSALLAILLVFTVIMQIFMPIVVYGLAPGFAGNQEQLDLTIFLTRITFPYLLFISLVSLYGGVLNSLNRFSAAAFVPVLLNLCMVITLLGLSKYTETPAHALSYGVALAGIVQLAWMLIACKRQGIVLKLSKPVMDSEVKLLLKRMVPGIIGSGVVQINVWIDTIIATLIPSAVSLLYYADRIAQFPLAIIGTAIGTVLLPTLSRQIREGKKEDAVLSQNRALEYALLLTLPAAAALAVIALPICSAIFERGAFGEQEAYKTALALAAYGLGLPAFVMIKVFTPGFFANGDTKTPVKIAILCVVLNTSMSLLLIHSLEHVGLALATSISAWVNTVLLATLLHKRDVFKMDARMKQRLPRIIFSVVMMSVSLWGTYLLLDYLLQDTQASRALTLLVLVGVGGIVYLVTAQLSKAFDVREVLKVMRRKA